MDTALLLRRARKRQQELDEIARLAYRAYLEGRGEEAAETYTAWIMGEISREEALRKLRQLVPENREGNRLA